MELKWKRFLEIFLLVLQAILIPREIYFSLISALKLWKEIKKEKAENEISEIKNRSSMLVVPFEEMTEKKKGRKKKLGWVSLIFNHYLYKCLRVQAVLISNKGHSWLWDMHYYKELGFSASLQVNSVACKVRFE